MAEAETRLPIKIVIPQDEDLSRPRGGGGDRKVFGEVDRSVREKLLVNLSSVRQHFADVLVPQGLPAVARVVLKDEALAKSHRPLKLFSRQTCPVIGSETFGSLLVSVNLAGLTRLEQTIDHLAAEAVVADISTLDRIEPYTAEDAVGSIGMGPLGIAVRDTGIKRLKFRLFRHRDQKADARLLIAFKELVLALGLAEPEQIDYADDLRLFSVKGLTPESIPALAKFVGTQSVRPFSAFHLVAQYIPQGTVTADRLAAPDPAIEYPIVGLIDSGTDPNNSFLQAWVIHRDEDDVPRVDQDNNHGSFVAGLIAGSRGLNHGDLRFPSTQAKVLDIVAMPKDGTPVYEDDLLRTIRRAVAKWHKKARVWNLSISRVSEVCRDDAFSDFAVALDSLQERYGVTFVICAGNYVTAPFRKWPATDLGDEDRIHPPADSIHAVTVGSTAHNEHASSCVKVGQPSPFSRRGPGAAYLPKPEVCHYGGNCDATGNCQQIGVISVDGHGNLAEAVGTSFSTPMVSSVLANIRAGVTEPISQNLAKALLIQSAALESEPVTAKELPYRGFGIPGEVANILTCAPWQATLIFEPELQTARKVFHKLDFPIPDCFRRPDRLIEGEFLMTLVYDPLRDASAGAEYCRANVDVSLGTYDPGRGGKPAHHKQIPLQPADYSKLYEAYLVEHGFKWSPVKVFRRRLQRVGGSRWRLEMRLIYRSELDIVQPQRVALVVTMFDPERKKPVYDDAVKAMTRSGWLTQDLRVDERLRLRGRS